MIQPTAAMSRDELEPEPCPPGIWAGFAAWERFLRESADWYYRRRWESAPEVCILAEQAAHLGGDLDVWAGWQLMEGETV